MHIWLTWNQWTVNWYCLYRQPRSTMLRQGLRPAARYGGNIWMSSRTSAWRHWLIRSRSGPDTG